MQTGLDHLTTGSLLQGTVSLWDKIVTSGKARRKSPHFKREFGSSAGTITLEWSEGKPTPAFTCRSIVVALLNTTVK